jgi:HK97 family phage major capsid protein
MPTMTIQGLLEKLAQLQQRGTAGEDVSAELAEAREELTAIKAAAGGDGLTPQQIVEKALRENRGGSRFPSPNATNEILDILAAGGSIQDGQVVRPGEKLTPPTSGTKSLSGAMTKALSESVPSAGGVLVPQEVAAEVLGLVRARSAVMSLGPTIQPVRKVMAIDSIVQGATAGWVGENEPAPMSQPEFDQEVLLEPKELTALLAASNRLVRDAQQNPNLDQVLREELAEVMALAADHGYLEGSGSAHQPLGVMKDSRLTAAPALGANGASPTFDNLKDMVANIRMANGRFQKPGWVFSPRLINTLEKIKDTTGRYLADAGLLTFDATGGGGTLLGFRFQTTTSMPINVTKGSSTDTTSLLFGSDWQEAWVGVEEALTINISREAGYKDQEGDWQSAFQNRQTLWLAESVTDIKLRRPQWFSVMSGVRP